MIELPNRLVSKFADAINQPAPQTIPSVMLGTVTMVNGEKQVQIDGSSITTPAYMAMSGEPGDRVLVSIQNHSAVVTANITAPAATTKYVERVDSDLTTFKDVTIKNILSDYIRTDQIDAEIGNYGYLKTDELESKVGTFGYLKSKELESEVGKFGYLRADEAKLKYADIGLANVNNAWIENGIIKDGSIGSGAIHDGAITNAKIADATIEAAKIKSINADNIIAGTIKTDRLIITGKDGEESIVEVINRANGVSEAEINNTKIQAASIDVADLSAFQAQIAGFDMSNYAIYSGKTSIKDPASGIYISIVGIGMGDGALTGKNESPLQAYADGSFKLIGKNSKFDFNTVSGTLDMEVSSLKIASKSVATSDDIDDVLSEKTTVIEIESSNGAPLKDGVTTTALSVIIYNGQNRITTSEELHKVMSSDVHLKWYYKTNDQANHIDIPANDSRISNDGFKLVPTADDIANRVSFKCRLVSTGSGYIAPDRETAIDRVASRLQDYVDETILPSVKDDITSEINKDVYVSQIEQNKDNIEKLQDEVANSDVRRGKQRQVGKACLWYHDFYHFGNTDEEAAAVIAQNDIVVAGGTLYSGKFSDADRDRQIAIIQKAKKLNPKLKIFYYITIASWRKDGDWSHILGKGGYWDEEEASKHPGAVRIHTKWEIYQLLEYACHVGGTKNGKKEFIETYTWTDDDGLEHTEDKYIDLYEGGIALDGCFYDDAGMETEEGRVNQGFPIVLREKYIQLVDYTHNKGLIAFPNQMSQDWYADTVSTANPDGLPSAIGENDYMLLESCHSQVGFSGRPLWRHVNNTTNVWNYYQNWYPKVGAKVVVNDYLYGTHTGEKLSDEEFYELATYLVCDTLCSGAHYIDMNGLRTWELPDFFDELLISDDTEYDITREAAGHYILHANGHTLEVIRGENLAQGETVSLKTLNKVYIYFDGIRIKNGFKKVPQYAYETDQRLGTVEDELEKLQTSSKSTASIYHRMMIDDWTSEYIYTNFATTTEFIKSIVDKAKTGIATVDSVDYGTNSLKLTRLTNSQIVQFLTVDISNKKGHTLEFGWTVNEVTKSNNWGFNTESPAVTGWTTIRPSMNNTRKSSLYGENFYGYVKTVTIPEDTEEDTWRFRIVYNGAAGEVFDLSNFYVIDVDEYGEDITKDWYTNLIPTLAGAVNNNNLTICYELEKLGDYDFNITWNDPDNYANWSGLRWNIPSGSFVPGHTYEFGCETYEHNAGSANVAFRLYYPGANKWIPVTLKIKSTIYGDERPGFIFTVPESATATDGHINFTNTSGKYQNSAGDYIQATIKGMYLYDVNEENIVIRGEEPSNSYMQICRVSKEKLEKDKKLIGNAVYIVDDGTMFVTDFNGNRTDISSSVASYGPVEQDFGLAWLGWSNDIERGNGIENDAIMFSKHEIVGMQRLNLYRLADSKPQFTEKTLKILKRARELNPKLRTFEYIQSESGRTDFTYNGDHAHLNSDGSWEGSTADLSGCTRIYTYQQICDWLDYFKESGTDGVFFDDWGYDFTKEDICYQMGFSVDNYTDKNAALNQKWIMLIEACHKRGLFLITNGGMPFSVGDWYTYLDENDIICLESCLISSTNYKDDFAWENGQKNIYDYYVNWYSNGKCKAKLWSMNYFQSDADGAYREQVLTYLCAITLACGGHYVSMGAFRCIEKPEFVQLFATGDTKTIKKIDDNTYQLKVNNHILEVHKWSNLFGKVSEETAAKNYYVLDGRKFCNGFLTAPVVDGELAGEIEGLSKKLNSMGDDSRKNAISYWRMAIDDWSSALSFMDYTNLIQLDAEAHSIDNGTIQTVTNSDGSLDIVCTYKELSQGGIYLNVIRPSNYEDFDQTGSGLEFGFSDVIFDMTDDSWTLPNGTVYEAAWLWATPSFYIYVDSTPLDETSVTDYKIDGVGSDLGAATGHYKKSQQKTFTSYNIRIWFHAPEGKYFNGTITIKDAYLIDLGEHEDEVSKKWYTNIFPGTFNTTSAMTAQRTLAEKNGQKVYDFTVSHTNAWGWIKYKYTGDELLALRGHTVELGCTSLTFSNGETGVGSASNGWVNYAFGIGANTDNPNTVRLYADTVSKSEVWDNERLCCLRYTIPDDATSLVIGFQSFGFPTDVTAAINGVYLYDLSEEVAIRGKTSTNASLQLCRVTESQESLTPSNMRNALYVTEKGRIYCYDLSGVKTDIAGSIYIGAAEAGYTGSPEEFGSVLFGLIQNGGTGSAGDLDISATIKEKLRLESDESYIYLKYDSEEISKIPFKGMTPDPDPEPDPTVTVHIAKGASWFLSGTDPKLGGNTARAYSYTTEIVPSTNTLDSVHKYGILLENGKTYTIKLDSAIAPGCYYGFSIWSASGRILDPGWKAAGTDSSYTPSSDGLYLYVNFKSGSAGSATITDEILETMINGFSITKEAVS